MNSLLPNDTLDLRGTGWPRSYVKASLIIEELVIGELLEILLDDGEPIRNVPRSMAAKGHDVVGIERLDDGSFSVFVRKGQGG